MGQAGGALLRAGLGAAVFASALAVGTTAGDLARQAGVQQPVAAWTSPVVVTAVALSLVALLRRRLDRGSMAGLGLVRPRAVLAGMVAALLPAALVLTVDAAAGGVRVISVDVPVLLVFLLSNTLLALLLEALPEEVSLRGYTFTALVERWPVVLAGVLTTVLFSLSPGLSSVLRAGLAAVSGQAVPPLSLAPVGMDLWAYLVLLLVFGGVLVVVRVVTGSVWACVGFHLAFLTVNRLLLPGFDTGVELRTAPGTELLVLLYLGLAAAGLLLADRRRRRRGTVRDQLVPGR